LTGARRILGGGMPRMGTAGVYPAHPALTTSTKWSRIRLRLSWIHSNHKEG